MIHGDNLYANRDTVVAGGFLNTAMNVFVIYYRLLCMGQSTFECTIILWLRLHRFSSISGGYSNKALAPFASVGGGGNHVASG